MSKSVKELLDELDLTELAIHSNIAYGTEIFKRNAVEFINIYNDEIEAWSGGLDGTVREGGGSRRHVWIYAKDNALNWHCSGNPRDHDIFCKHCVAVTLAVKS